MVKAKVEAVVNDRCWRGRLVRVVMYTWRRRRIVMLSVMWLGQTARGPVWSMAARLILTDVQRWPMSDG